MIVTNLNQVTNVVPGATYTETLTINEGKPIAINVYSLNDVLEGFTHISSKNMPRFSLQLLQHLKMRL